METKEISRPTNSEDQNKSDEPKEINISDINVENENIALNMLITFIQLAHKRGAFSIQESSKIWECVSKFMKKN